ncbi:hypothetical protein [Streptomyces sp. enrichment culture]|uniref:hypothetical protein n=1 Tax=Streptomyces sp. enrichment culture TaxID=1795815 RepID=UPI003F5531E1
MGGQPKALAERLSDLVQPHLVPACGKEPQCDRRKGLGPLPLRHPRNARYVQAVLRHGVEEHVVRVGGARHVSREAACRLQQRLGLLVGIRRSLGRQRWIRAETGGQSAQALDDHRPEPGRLLIDDRPNELTGRHRGRSPPLPGRAGQHLGLHDSLRQQYGTGAAPSAQSPPGMALKPTSRPPPLQLEDRNVHIPLREGLDQRGIGARGRVRGMRPLQPREVPAVSIFPT